MIARSPLALAVLALLVACEPKGASRTFDETIRHPDAAFMSVGGTGPDDVWVVGATPGPNDEPVVLRRKGDTWSSVSTGQRHDLWWVHAFADGPAFLGGGGATVLRVDGDAITRTPTPQFFGNTVFGLWGAAPDDVWAVGGFAGRAGFAWHYDGQTWTDVPLPDDLPRSADGEIPSLFKVWGRSSTDVWAVGGNGTILHWNGADWSVVPSGTNVALFTVNGTDDEVYIVGGLSSGVVLRGGLGGFIDDTPEGAPLLQGLTVDGHGYVWVAGANGFAATRKKQRPWKKADLGFDVAPQSVHALWFDGERDILGAGGGVLSPRLDDGVVCTNTVTDFFTPQVIEPPAPVCPADRVDPAPDGSIARRWVEQLLGSIRRDIPHPPKHARNIHHVSLAIFDAWAAYDPDAIGVLFDDKPASTDVEGDREVAISYAAYRVLQHRYATAIGSETSLDCYDKFITQLGLDPSFTDTTGDSAAAVGNRIGYGVIDAFANDGANEANDLADTTGWAPSNPVMIVDRPGSNVTDPDVWQQLNLGTAETQNGIVLDDSVQPYIGPHWREVTPFALTRDPVTGLYTDPGAGYPTVNDPEMADWVIEVIRKTAELDVRDGVTFDASPASLGNNPLGADVNVGHAVNPVTGQPYAPNIVKRGDFTRVVAEMWADGPASETPPGHWLRLSLEVGDRLDPAERRRFGVGEPVDRLAWDAGVFLTLGGAVHDAAISAWELKRDSLGPRPVTLIRWMADNGQRTDPSAPSFHPDGLPLVPGLTEVITEASSAPGEPHFHLRWYLGEVAVWSWPGEPGDRFNDDTPLQWMRARDWIPYQRRTFVTPAFPGFTSGHSTFSRAAAEALTGYTGTPFFPGGMMEWVAPERGYLVFESGPSQDLRLQWATYYDAADQSGQSRLWGGIHIWPDDYQGRINGATAGLMAVEKAAEHVLGAPLVD